MLAKIRLPRFFSYQFFKNAKIGVFNTAASIQPNPFWFWEKYTYTVSRGHIFSKSHPCSSDHNFGSIKDTDLINTAIDRYLIDLSKVVR